MTPLPGALRACERLEAFLGDPARPGSRLSWARAAALDEAERYPDTELRLLSRWGLPLWHVPRGLGGRLDGFEELLGLTRSLSRRDLSVALAHGKSFLGAVGVWVAGSPAQRRRLAALLARGGRVALALTEREAGGDLLRLRSTVVEGPSGLRLTGEKWLINNGTRGQAACVLARHQAGGSFRGYSLLLVEKARQPRRACVPLPKVRTMGMRAADISGLRFVSAPLGRDALVGPAGSGLDTALKGLQVTRVLCAGFSLGAGDTALRAALDFATRRRVGEGVVAALPYPRRQLVESFLDLLACECAALAAARALRGAPEELAVHSAAVKYLVPERVDAALRRLASVLGARHYLREAHLWGMFQKMQRDHAVVGLFDGSATVNLAALSRELGALLGPASPRGSDAPLLRLDAELPPFVPERLSTRGNGGDGVTRAGLRGRDAMSRLLVAERASLRAEHARLSRRLGAELARSPEGFALAGRYAALHAAAACAGVWRAGRGLLRGWFARPDWARLCVSLLLGRPLDAAACERAARELLRLHRERRAFSLLPLRPLP